MCVCVCVKLWLWSRPVGPEKKKTKPFELSLQYYIFTSVLGQELIFRTINKYLGTQLFSQWLFIFKNWDALLVYVG